MGDADDLSSLLSHLLHDERHAFGYLPTHTRVYLIEDDRGQVNGTAYHRLE